MLCSNIKIFEHITCSELSRVKEWFGNIIENLQQIRSKRLQSCV